MIYRFVYPDLVEKVERDLDVDVVVTPARTRASFHLGKLSPEQTPKPGDHIDIVLEYKLP